MTTQIALRIPAETLAALDDTVKRGRFENRTAAVRAAIDRLLAEEREAAIDAAYRRGYGKHPQEEWIGELGLAAMSALVEAEQAGQEPL